MKVLQIHLVSRPDGQPKASNFAIAEVELPPLKHGQVLVKNHVMSVDPYMRRSMEEVATDLPPWPLRGQLDGPSVGEVVESKNPAFRSGDIVESMSGWQDYFISDGDDFVPYISANTAIAKRQVDASIAAKDYLGILGVAAQTGYFGMMHGTAILNGLVPGETLAVSSAAGVVGSVACQIGKIHEMRVIGSAGSDNKVAWLRETLGLDHAFNYKTTAYAAGLVAGAPNGIDLVIENASPEHLSACFPLMNEQKLILIAGLVGIYSTGGKVHKLDNFEYVLDRFLTVKSYPFMEFLDHYDSFVENMLTWRKAGKMLFNERQVEGLENAPLALQELLSGDNHGKILVSI